MGRAPFSYWFPGDDIDRCLCSKYFLLACFCFNFVYSIFLHTEVLNFNVVEIIALYFMAPEFLNPDQKGFSTLL